MPDFEGVSQETFDSINNEILNDTQEQQTEQIMEAAPVEAPTAPEAPAAAPEPAAEEAPQERVAGQEGTVRGNPLQGVMDAVGGAADALAENMEGGRVNILDFVDNVFQGDQKTKEEIAAERQQTRADAEANFNEKAQEAVKRDPVGAAVADTLVNAVPGGAIDAVEDVLGAAEVVGDTVKTFATLGNVNESQNPFSSNYDWAQWRLGADEIGAKTAVGQFAQELVSFAAIGSRLGAFRSAAAGTGVVKAGLIEAGYGMATDAIKGLAGEGNFANMLEELIPGLKDTWVTALAVDEDDNPWESAVKSALDGAAIGFPVGVISAMASATRAVKNLPVAEQAAKFTEVFSEKVRQLEIPLGSTRTTDDPVQNVSDIFDQISSSNPDEIEAGMRAAETLNKEDLTSLFQDFQIMDFAPYELLHRMPIDLQLKYKPDATKIKKLRNGSEVHWQLKDATNETEELVDKQTYRIDWDMPAVDAAEGGLGEGAAGVEMFKHFNEIAAELKPGAILVTEAAIDGFGQGISAAQERAGKLTGDITKWIQDNSDAARQHFEANGGTIDEWTAMSSDQRTKYMVQRGAEGVIPEMPDSQGGKGSVRERLYKRAGFSDPLPENNLMYAVVTGGQKGRKRLMPLDIKGDIEAQLNKAYNTGVETYTQSNFGPLEVVADRVKAGVPVYWDDVAATVPEMFTPGTRAIENPEFPPEVLKALRDPGDGVTINPFTGEVPETGTMVAIDGKSLTSFEPEDISDFIAQNYDILTREDVFLGGWVSEITGKPVVELSRRVESFEEAKALGQAFDQEGVFRMDDFSYHATGGIDRLKETQGFHMKSAYTQKNYVREPGDAQSIARAQFTPGAPNGAIGGRIMTDEQLHLIGDALPEKASEQLDKVMREMDVQVSDVVSESRISRAELWDRVSEDLGDFIDAGGKVDLNKLPTMKYGDDDILTREGALQARILIQNIAGTIWDEARVITMKDGQNIDTESSIEVMVDGLKALARLRKKTVNIFGTRLSDEGMKLENPNVFERIFSQKGADEANNARLANLSTDEMDAVDKALDDMVSGFKSGDPKRARQAMRTAEFLQLSGGDPVKMARVARGIPQLYGDVALKHMYNSLLSAPATHVVNNLSNFTNTLARPIQAALGGQAAAARASFYNFGEMLGESFELAGRTWSGENLAQGAKVASAGEVRMALDNLAEKVATGQANNVERINSGILHTLYDMAEWPVLAWPSKFLTTSDEFFKAMNARMEYRVQNYMEAAQNSDGDPSAMFVELMEKNKDLAFGKKSGAVMDPQLLDVAQELTFQTKLEGPAGRFAAFVDESPLLRPFFPFVKTGHNIMVFTGTHTPVLNLALSESRRALRGELGPYAQAVHRGRLAMGSMVMMGAGLALQADRLTGAGPAEKKAREAWLRTHQPRSIKIGDRWYSYDRLEPFGQLLSAVADVHYGLTTGELEHDRAAYKVNYLVYALSTNFSDKTFFQGVKDLATLLNPSGPGVLNRLQTITLGTANNFLPAAGLRRSFYNAMTPYMQEFHKPGVDRIKQQMGLPIEPPADRVDFLDGSKIPAQQGGFGNAVLPIKTTEAKSDTVRDALAAIEFDQASIRKELGDIKLTPTQSNRLNELMSQTGLYKALEKIVSAPKWAAAVAEHRAAVKAGTTNIPKERMLYYSMITDEIRRAQKIALEYLLEEDYELALSYYNNKQVNQDARMGVVEGLLQNPNR